ncbi:rubrerythrin family protein [Geosporobacter ferrireducens]|uniref:Rubrerythrin-2 n=1 Tax=Geosporobacter ferrireducens TaxID=1424294 RepID=A0A1D8GCL0_9FIRM|nr:rubrerythrin family protein [Geosporobacter ferrireducens]AOT68644.1 Rubrerythrin-2 [Geosporobacter ferrireducens]MTI54118.1 rubrerythrin family protein [Geosporobacter ferrireducens]
MAVKNDMTADFLRSAYGGESMAHMRYLIWGDVADKEGFPNVGRLFRAIAYAEWAHADNHFRELGEKKIDFSVTAGAVFGLGKTIQNLQGGIDGELHEIEQMYPVYLNAARFQEEKGAERAFHYALEAEKIHAKLFQEAQEAVRQGNDMKLDDVHVCQICGHTTADGLPDNCPICGAKSNMYKTFSKA